ncbi:SGNH/GDSL hydrolase family protein [Parvularcula dongshanensis]|uniref:Lysophospholipase L1-like esterase n=1 Tax=Parvularcula dongshanensis TaxID=1173995 RepID=A0A840I5D9_9PROT|nr:SGNH/GDSL hydrolase family protein [Parvularcula dongshanensis]MBB4659493.1 lysophospholipase L1-like esterase [Parvularcula dongshanensis]
MPLFSSLLATGLLAMVQPGTPTLPEALTPLGRTVGGHDSPLQVGWPASGFAFETRARRVVMTVQDSGANMFDVMVDGTWSEVALRPGVHDYTLFEASEPRDVRIEVRRKTESFEGGLTTILGVESDGEVRPAALPDRRILFVGDSITAGYGTLGADASCGYSKETSAPQLAFSGRTAKALEADYHLVAISGRGAVFNYGDDPRPNMPAHLTLALPDTPVYWDPKRWTPQVVVVNLGTNDHSTWDPEASFVGNYTGLLVDLRAQYPDAKIVTVTGPFASEDAVERIVAGVAEARARAEALGVKTATVHLSLADEGRVYGCDGHPGTDSTRVMADGLVPVIEAETGWSAGP